MRVLLGLVALAHVVCGASYVPPTVTFTTGNGINGVATTNGGTQGATINVVSNLGSFTTATNPQTTTPNSLNVANTYQTTTNTWTLVLTTGVTSAVFTVLTNQYVSQMAYAVTKGGWTCDSCCSASVCTSGPNPSIYPCSQLTRVFTVPTGGFTTAGNPAANGSGLNYFGVDVWDSSNDQTTFAFYFQTPTPIAHGDPQIYGLQGQDFQVHGIPDEIFNLVTYPNLQVNARFVYLSHAECNDNFTACFAHPGTYIGEEGIRVGNDKIHVKSGSFKKGLSVSINGQKVQGTQKIKLGSVKVMNHRRVIVDTPVMTLTISNSDKFLNQETVLHDTKLLALGQERRVLADGDQFHPEVPLHGLQGQTWRNVEYPSGLEYEGSINDYHVVDGNLFGNDFVFNQFKL